MSQALDKKYTQKRRVTTALRSLHRLLAGDECIFLKQKRGSTWARADVSGSPGRIRTYDTLINSQLRYHCATGEYAEVTNGK